MKDGMGMIGGLVFSYFASSHFDSHVKEFRLFADFINDVGLFLDMVGPTLLIHHRRGESTNKGTSLVLIVSSFATLCRVMCGMAAGATKGSITQHFSKHNMADLNSKEGTQETLISLLGMILGIFLARYLQKVEEIHGNGLVQLISWLVFSLLTILHIWANYRAVSILRLRTLNQLRTECALDPLVHVCALAIKSNIDPTNKSDLWNCFLDCQKQSPLLLPPDKVNESFVRNAFGKASIHLGSELKKTFENVPRITAYHALRNEFRDENYVAFIRPVANQSKSRPIHVSLRYGATDDDILKALTHALVLRSCSHFQEDFIARYDYTLHCFFWFLFVNKP